MQLTFESTHPCVRASTYSLAPATDRPYVILFDPQGKRRAELFALAGVHTLTGRDDTVAVGAWTVEEHPGEICLSLTVASSLWQRKTIRFRCQAERFSYEIEVEGRGDLTDVTYFGGYSSAHVRWGSGHFWSWHDWKRGFNPEPTSQEQVFFNPAASSAIDLGGVPLPGKASWFFTPPPFAFAFGLGKRWVGIGVEAVPCANRYSQLTYRAQSGGFAFDLSFDGYTHVDGTYTLPALGFDFAPDAYAALGCHVQALRDQQFAVSPHTADLPAWWNEPIYCGWGSQCHVAAMAGERAPDFARQPLYEEFLGALEHHGIVPGIVVLDDKWQLTYGDNRVDPAKWHDLRGFIDAQHAAGRKVLLWLKAWDAEGIPADECITNAAGVKLAVDPTNPAFEQRFRESIRVMLQDYDADGFKLDFTARIPTSPGLRLYENVWGLELMKRYLSILYSAAKSVKRDALVMAHTPHPYLADVLDMIRLNDVNAGKPVNPAMTHRARVATLACPSALIDTDNWQMPDKAAWRAYVQLQPTLGVPSLYYATHIDSTGAALTEEDYALVRAAWAQYRKEQACTG
ncbi:MAG: hypothetical protein IAE80_19930 [Anaerolinea sp.]|nr:hypothetical protein [Anaerolinea sp.]